MVLSRLVRLSGQPFLVILSMAIACGTKNTPAVQTQTTQKNQWQLRFRPVRLLLANIPFAGSQGQSCQDAGPGFSISQ